MVKKVKKTAKGGSPVPVKAEWSSDCVGLLVTFDRPLRRQDISQSQWAVYVGGWVRRSLGARVVRGKCVGIRTISVGVRTHKSYVNYKPGGGPVTGVDGALVKAFDEFIVNAPAVRNRKK